jgi:hypothetical protein
MVCVRKGPGTAAFGPRHGVLRVGSMRDWGVFSKASSTSLERAPSLDRPRADLRLFMQLTGLR